MPGSSSMAGLFPAQAPGSRPETSPATPALGKPKERLAKFFKTSDPLKLSNYEKWLRDCWKQTIDDWTVERREVVREILRAIEYRKGNQHIGWDPLSCTYKPYSDILRTESGATGSEQSRPDLTPQKNVNIIDWLTRVWCSTLGAAIPGVEWWPGDSDSDLDARAAVARDRAYKKIASDNEDKDFLAQCLEFLFLTGSYFRYIRWSMDPALTDEHYEDIVEMRDQQISPDRFECPSCGAEAPVDLSTGFRESIPCPQCGRKLTPANFYPGVSMKMPVVTGQKKVANGGVRWDVLHGLSVQVSPHANTNGGGVIANTPLVELQREITKGAFRRMYPDDWALGTQTASDSSGNGSAEIARMARMCSTSPAAYRWSGATATKLNTIHSVWFKPEAITAIDKKEDAEELAELVGDGCVGVFYQDKLIDIQSSVARKCFSWCGAQKGAGAYPKAPVRLALDFQDRINDRVDSCDSHFDRLGNPPILFNQTVFGEELDGMYMEPGTMLGVPVNGEVGLKLQDTVWQPQFHQDNGVMGWIEALIRYVQLLVGITPMTYGGSDRDIKTAKGQEQALRTAMGVLWLYWNLLRSEWAAAANLSVDCFAENATDDEYRVTRSEASTDFENEPIRLADLKGRADARVDANQNYPIGFEQQQELYRQLLMMANGKEPNPLVMEILDTYENRRQAMRYLGPPDMELPEQVWVDKIKADIQRLITEQPLPTGVPDPQNPQQAITKPPIEPDKDFYQGKWDLVIGQVMRYGVKNWRLLPLGSPADINLRAYLHLAVVYAKMEAAAGAAGPGLLDAGAPGWQGKLGGPAKPGLPPGPPQPPANGAVQ